MTYRQTVEQLKAAGLASRELAGDGFALVTLQGARLIGLAFLGADENLLFTHDELSNPQSVRDHPEKISGGIGGERLWFGPELRYHWHGVPDWETFANNRAPVEADPGSYAFDDVSPDTIALSATTSLPTTIGLPALPIRVRRSIKLATPPLGRNHPLMRNIQFVGVEMRHHLELDESAKLGKVDLWHILQTAPGSIAIVPLKHGGRVEPLSYGLAGKWSVRLDHVSWRLDGRDSAKFGLGVDAVTGRFGILRLLDDRRWSLIVRQFPVGEAGRYADHPYGAERNDQVVQVWDGFGFGELEYHSVALDAERGPRELHETDTIWAFAGSSAQIAALADVLLDVDIDDYMEGGSAS